MKAVQIKKYGHADVLEILKATKPRVARGYVLIQAHASCINPIDTVIREGYMQKMRPLKFPATLGSDVAGVVAEVGEGVADFIIGDKVYGSGIILAGATGAFAEFVATPKDLIARMPRNIDFNGAAASVLTGVSAVQALIEHIHLKQGQKILIHGGAGGIGTIAIQIAKKLGAYVVTTVTGEEAEYVKNLGADQIIDYKFEAFQDITGNCDAVFDTVGGQVYAKSFKVLKKDGVLVSMVAPIDQKLAEEHNVIAITQFTKVNTEHLHMLTKFIEDGTVSVHIDKIFPLDKIQEAFDAKEKGGVKGKIVIKIK